MRRRPTIPWLLPPLAGALVFLPALDAYFVGDDFDFLRLASYVDDLGEVVRTSFWGEYMPLFVLGFVIDHALWDLNPIGFHLHSLAYHLGTTVAAFFLLRRLSGDGRTGLIGSLLFAVHPIHDEAVIYIAARGHLGAAGLTLVALIAHARFRETGDRRMHAVGALALGIALFFKEAALVTPGLALLADACIYLRGKIRGLAERIRFLWAGLYPYAGVCLAYLALRFAAIRPPSDKVGDIPDYALELDRLGPYFLMDFLPLPGAIVSRDALETWGWLGAVLFLVVVIGCIVIDRRESETRCGLRRGTLLYAASFFALATLPFLLDEIGLRRRYAYVGSLAGCLLVAALLGRLLPAGTRWSRRVAFGMLALLVVGYGVATIDRSLLYRTSGRIAENVVEDVQALLPHHVGELRLGMLQFPRWTGGGAIGGAYLFHETDMRSLIRVFNDVRDVEILEAFDLAYSEDHAARVVRWDPRTILAEVSCRTDLAYEELLVELDDVGSRSPLGRLGVQSRHDDDRRLRLFVDLRENRFDDDASALLYFDDRHLRRIDPPPAGTAQSTP